MERNFDSLILRGVELLLVDNNKIEEKNEVWKVDWTNMPSRW